MEDMTATYSPEDNKLRLYSLHRLDAETYAAVKAAGFAWAPRQQLFVAPMWTPEREDLLLSLCGEISDEDTSLVDRAEERAERFEDYSDKRASEAEQARKSVSAIADSIPLGQPILVGHHSERRARKDAERIDNGMRKAINLWETSKYWQQRAAGALRHAKYKEQPDVRARRIKKLEAERRKMERHYKECEMWRKLWGKEGLTLEAARKLANLCYLTVEAETAERPYSLSAYTVLEEDSRWPWPVERVQAVAGAHYAKQIARCVRWMAHYDNRLAYEKAMLGESGGIAADRFDIKPGGRVLVRGEWVTVLRVNRKDGAITSVTTNARYVPKRSIEEVEDYMEPTEEAAAAVAEVSKKPPLCNYPGNGFEHITKAEWDNCSAENKSTHELGKGAINRYGRDYNTPETLAYARHRVRYLFRRMSLMPVYITDMKRKDPASAGAAQQESPKLQAPERDVYGMLAAQDRKKEPTEQEHAFDALRDQLEAGPPEVVAAPQLFPTPPAIAARMVEAADIAPQHSVLEPSAGTGNLLRAMEDGTITAVEVNASLVERLYQDFHAVDVRCADFLACNGDLGKFDRIVMNPPFKNGEDIKHIQHAAGMLKPGGRLVALCADGPRQGEKLRGLCDTWESLPEGSFSACGTGVRVAMLVITKPEAPRPLEDEHDTTQKTMQEAVEEAMQEAMEEATPCPVKAVAVATQQDARPFDISLYSTATGLSSNSPQEESPQEDTPMATKYSESQLFCGWLDVTLSNQTWSRGVVELENPFGEGQDSHKAYRRGVWGITGPHGKLFTLYLCLPFKASYVCMADSLRGAKQSAIVMDYLASLGELDIREAVDNNDLTRRMRAMPIEALAGMATPQVRPDVWHFSSLPEDVQHDILAHLDSQARAREENSKAIRPWNATLYSKAAGLQKAMVADGMVVDGADGTHHRNKWGKGLFNGKPGALNGHFWFAEGILPDDAVVMPKIQGENKPYELSWSYEFTEELPSPFAEEKRDQGKPFSAKNGVVVFDLHGVVVLLPLLAYLYILRLFPGVKFMAVADGKRRYEKPVAAVVDGEVKAIIMPLKDARYWNCDDAIERYRYSASVGKYLEAYDDIPTSSENEHAPCDAPAEEEESIPSQQFKIGERYEIEYTLEGKTTAGPATIAMVANGGGYLVFDTPALSFPLDASYVKVVRRLDPGEEVEFRGVHTATVPPNPMHAYPFQLRGESTFRDYYSGKPIDNQQYEGLVSVGGDSILMATWMEDGERAWGSIGASCPYLPDASYTATPPAQKEDAYPFQFPGDATFRDYDTGEPLADQQYEGLALVGSELALMVTWLDGKERAWELPASPSLGMAGPSCAYLPTFCYTESSRSLAPVLHDAHVAMGRMTPREYRRMVYDATMEGLRKGWGMVLATYTSARTVVDHAIKFDDARGEIMHRVGKSWYVVEYGMLDGLASQLGLPTSHDHRRAQEALRPVMEVTPIEEDVPDVPLTEAEQEAMAAKARATVANLVLQPAQWTTIDGVDVLRIPGSNYAAVPCTVRKDSRRFTVFTVDEREEYCHLTRKEVYGWLYAVAKTEIEEAEEFLASYTAPARSPSPAACSSGCVATMAYPWTPRISPVIGSAWATTSARTCRPPPARTEKSNLPSPLYSNPTCPTTTQMERTTGG